jgi:hypothetical protein
MKTSLRKWPFAPIRVIHSLERRSRKQTKLSGPFTRALPCFASRGPLQTLMRVSGPGETHGVSYWRRQSA